MSFNLMIDVDDVLFPWAQSIHDACQAAGLHDGSKMFESWSMWEDYGCSKEAWLEVVDQATVTGMYHNTPPIEGAAEALRRLWWSGHNIHLVTARGFMAHADEIREWTPQWVEEFAIPHDTLTFAKDKVAAQDEVGVKWDYAIDDGVHNYEALRSAGVNVSLMDAPHNRSFDAFHRVYSLDEWADFLDEQYELVHYHQRVLHG